MVTRRPRAAGQPDPRQGTLFDGADTVGESPANPADSADSAGAAGPAGPGYPLDPLATAREARAADRARLDEAAQALADGFGAQIERFSREAGADAAAAEAAGRWATDVSIATSAGHTCLRLADGEFAAVAPVLAASGVVERVDGREGAGSTPMALDADGRLYLRRYYRYECRIAADLIARAAAAGDSREAAALANDLLPGLGDSQRRAVQVADASRVTLVTGGPGTGKTTTVVAILGGWLARDPGLRVALAAPTGKAAARMLAAVRARAQALPADVRGRLPSQATTLHRLLGSTGPGGRFRHDARHRLPIDALVVDESSMLDVALAARLLDALPPAARLVLLGDADQLSAVDAGAVFAELVGRSSASLADEGPLDRTVVRLLHSHRFGEASAIGQLAAAIHRGDVPAAQALLRGPSAGLGWIEDTGDELSPVVRRRIVDGFAGYREALVAFLAAGAPADGRRAVFDAFDRFRVLSAARRGPRGVEAVERLMDRVVRDDVRAHAAQDDRSPWYAGRPVLVERNDPVLRLFNGDIGLALPDPSGVLHVWFPADDGAVRAVLPGRLPARGGAWAMTIHKSQGSEFDEVLTLLAPADSPLNRREGVYTAVTRSRRALVLAGDPRAFALACRTPTERDGGLRRRLRDAQAGAVTTPASPGSR